MPLEKRFAVISSEVKVKFKNRMGLKKAANNISDGCRIVPTALGHTTKMSKKGNLNSLKKNLTKSYVL